MGGGDRCTSGAGMIARCVVLLVASPTPLTRVTSDSFAFSTSAAKALFSRKFRLSGDLSREFTRRRTPPSRLPRFGSPRLHAVHSSSSAAISVRKGPARAFGSPRGSRVNRAQASTETMATSAPARVLPSLLPDGSGGGDDAGIYACLFDMDGTLCDTDPLHHEVFSNLLLAHGKNGGVPIDDDFFHKHIAGRTNEDIFADLWPELSVPEREAMWEKKEEDFRALAATKLRRLPGLTELLAWIDARGIRKVAVTNAPRPNAELMLTSLGLDGYFEHVVIGTECTRAKPHPDLSLIHISEPTRPY